MGLDKTTLNTKIAYLLAQLSELDQEIDDVLEASDGDKLNEVSNAIALAKQNMQEAQKYMKRVNGVYSDSLKRN